VKPPPSGRVKPPPPPASGRVKPPPSGRVKPPSGGVKPPPGGGLEVVVPPVPGEPPVPFMPPVPGEPPVPFMPPVLAVPPEPTEPPVPFLPPVPAGRALSEDEQPAIPREAISAPTTPIDNACLVFIVSISSLCGEPWPNLPTSKANQPRPDRLTSRQVVCEGQSSSVSIFSVVSLDQKLAVGVVGMWVSRLRVVQGVVGRPSAGCPRRRHFHRPLMQPPALAQTVQARSSAAPSIRG
jgi:hypothetical protein